MPAKVLSVSRSSTHSFSKQTFQAIEIIAGLGVEGDAHAGITVKHRYLVRKNPSAPNLAQVHLLQSELFAELQSKGIDVDPGQLGENITTSGLDLLALPLGTELQLGAEAVVEVTGLRTPCNQMNKLRPGLMKACLGQDQKGGILRKAGIMAIALHGGTVHLGDEIKVKLPARPWVTLGPV